MNEPTPQPRSTWRKVAITVAGGLVVLAGLLMLVLPGPGLVVLAAGLAILATEYVWARRLLQSVRERIKQAVEKAKARRH
jgi:uncharacterized protein (TIGR02611 family)